jgi:2-(1,2-epoxy-1,2-dihydrophenyl)acetyl-CoA isomerase
MPQDILVEQRDRVLVITLNRPQVLNAFRMTMAIELKQALQEADEDDGVGCVVLTGAGRGFCSGADLRGFFDNLREATEGSGASRPVEGLPRFMIELKKPVIAAINGPAVGVGLTLTLPCDIRIASDRARLGFIFSRLALVPEFGSTFLLPRIIGLAKALELCLTARIIDAPEALAVGLVNKVVPHDDLMDEALALGMALANGPTRALSLVKKVIHQGLVADVDQAQTNEEEAFAWCLRSPEHFEGVRAFFEKREARFH